MSKTLKKGPSSGTGSLCDWSIIEKGYLDDLIVYWKHRKYENLGSIIESHRTYNICLRYVASNPGNVIYVPTEHLTREMLKTMVDTNVRGGSLKPFPANVKTFALCIRAVELGCSILDVPEEFIKTKMLKAAIGEYVFFPAKYKSVELTLYYIEKYPNSFGEIPKEHFTLEVAKAFLKTSIKRNRYSLEDRYPLFDQIPKMEFSYQDILEITPNYPEIVLHIDPKMITEELMILAAGAGIIRKLPKAWWTEKVIISACVHGGPRIFKYDLAGYITFERLMASLELCGSFKDIPDSFLQEPIVLKCLKHDHKILTKYPKDLFTPEFMKKAVEINPKSIKYFEQPLSEELMIIAVTKSPKIINKFNGNFRIPDKIWQIAVNLDPQVIQYWESKQYYSSDFAISATQTSTTCPVWLTYDIALKCVKSQPNLVDYIPDCFLTTELLLHCVSNNGLLLKSVPEKKLSFQLCEAAFKNNPASARYIPIEFFQQ